MKQQPWRWWSAACAAVVAATASAVWWMGRAPTGELASAADAPATKVGAPPPAVVETEAMPPPPPVPDAARQRKARLLAEVVLRLQGADLAADAETRAMVDKALAANVGTPAFVEIVAAFALRGHDAELLRLAAAPPDESSGAQALRLVLANGGLAALAAALQGPDAAPLATALGHANDQRALELLAPLVEDAGRDLRVRRAAVRAIGQYEAGAMALIARCQAGTLPAELRPVAVGVLANAPWDTVRAAARPVLPAPSTVDAQLPPIHELVARRGDVGRGATVFRAVCSTCHRVAGEGIDYGPDLSVIGSKLGKDGLYQAVLYPDAGVEFNYETTQLTLRDGNAAIGIVVSDSEAAIAIKSIGGIVTTYPRADVVGRSRQKTSSMPTGLQGSLRQQELVDLVEYLAALQKP